MADTNTTTTKGKRGRPPKAAQPTKTVSTNNTIKEENEMLKAQLAELQKQMAALAQQMTSNNAVMQTPINNTPSVGKKDRSITFVNMTPGAVVLRGSQTWVIEGQFKSRKFSEREAIVIISNMSNCIRSGKVYIADADFVKENDLYDAYQYILSDKDLKTLLDKDPTYIIEAYKMVDDGQKDIIIDMIVDRLNKGAQIDGNVLLQLGKLSGRDLLAIEPLEDE